MFHHSHSKKSDYTHLLESINAFTKFITDFTDSKKRHHDSFLATFHLLQNQIQEQIHTTTPIPSTETVKPPSLTLQLSDGSNPMKPVPESQQLTVQGGDVSCVDGLASFSPITVPDSPSEGPHLSVVYLRPTFPRKPSGQDSLYKLDVTTSIDPSGVSILMQPKDVAIGDAVSALVAVDAPIFDTSPYDPGPLNSQSPTTETTPPSYWKTSFAGDHFLIFGQISDVRSKMDFIHMIEPVRNTLVQPRHALHDIVPISGCFVHPQDLVDGWIGFPEHYISILHDKVALCAWVLGFIGASKYDLVISIIEGCDNFSTKCGFSTSARQVLEEMPKQDVISWTAVTQALVARGNGSGKGQAEWMHSYEVVLGLTRVRAENLQLVTKCLNALSIMACTDPSLFGWPMMLYGSFQSLGGSILWNGINTGARIRSLESDCWFADILLSVNLFERLIKTMQGRGIRLEKLAGSKLMTAEQSKFMIDLHQIGMMLRHATSRSMCLADEFGEANIHGPVIIWTPLSQGLANLVLDTSCWLCKHEWQQDIAVVTKWMSRVSLHRWLSSKSSALANSKSICEAKFLSQQSQTSASWANFSCAYSMFSSGSVQFHWSQWLPSQNATPPQWFCSSKGLLGCGLSGIMIGDAIIADSGTMHLAGVALVNPSTIVVWEIMPRPGNSFQVTPKISINNGVLPFIPPNWTVFSPLTAYLFSWHDYLLFANKFKGELEGELFLWASYRGHILIKTDQEMMYIRQALERKGLDMQVGNLSLGYFLDANTVAVMLIGTSTNGCYLEKMGGRGHYMKIKRTIVAIEGGLYYSYTLFMEYLPEALNEILGKEIAKHIILKVTVDGAALLTTEYLSYDVDTISAYFNFSNTKESLPHFQQWDPGGSFLHWQRQPELEITWVDDIEFVEAGHDHNLEDKYLLFDLEDKIILKGDGNDTVGPELEPGLHKESGLGCSVISQFIINMQLSFYFYLDNLYRDSCP